jgi:hypothetical protein
VIASDFIIELRRRMDGKILDVKKHSQTKLFQMKSRML